MRIFGRIIGVFYAFLSSWLLSIDLSYRTKIGKGLIIYHGMGLVVNPEAIIGENVQLRHHTTIGNSLVDHKSPIIGNNVNIGCHVIIIGNIKIGNNCIIGAGSVITKNVPDNTIVAGNPAYIIRKNGLKCKEKL